MSYRQGLICAGLALCCLAIYGQTLTHDFVNYDDGLYVTDNAEVQAGLSWTNVVWAFTTDRAMYMHPLTWMSHMLDCTLYGLKPWGHHLTNLLLHTINSILLFLVLARMTGRMGPSALVAALFAVHPLHVESVAWVAERKDLLSMLFWTAGLGAYAWHRQRPSLPRYAATAFLFLLGFLSKPMVVTFPFVLLLLDCWPLAQIDLTASTGVMARNTAQKTFEKLPLFLMTLVMCVVTMVMQTRGDNLWFMEKISLLNRCANAVVVYVLYLVKTVWPADLAVYYPHPITRPAWQVAGAALILVAVTLFCLRQARRRPYLLVGWLWYLGTLVPVIELVQAGTFSHADRYTYIPLIGIFIMAAFGLDDLRRARAVPAAASACVVTVMLAGLILAAINGTARWKNSETLFRHALAVTPDNALARNNLGEALFDRKQYDSAGEQFARAVDLDPKNSTAVENVAVVLQSKGQYEEAAARHREALTLNPRYVKAAKNLTFTLKKLGKLDAAETEYNLLVGKENKSLDDLCRMGTLAMTLRGPTEAFNAFAEAMKIDPNGRKTNLAIAAVLVDDGKYEEALGYYGKALAAQPNDAETLYNMGVVLSSLNRTADAAAKYLEALRCNPDFARAHNNLASLLANNQRMDEAVEHYRKAIALDQKYAQARINLARVLAFQGKVDEAVGLYEQAIALEPASLRARLDLAGLLAEHQRGAEAEALLAKVLEMDPKNTAALKLMEKIGANKAPVPPSEGRTP